MDLSFIQELYVPIVIIACLVIGYILKKWIVDLDNKFIPTILAVIGAGIGCLVAKDITVELVIGGAVSGLASTGFHPVIKQLIGE